MNLFKKIREYNKLCIDFIRFEIIRGLSDS